MIWKIQRFIFLKLNNSHGFTSISGTNSFKYELLNYAKIKSIDERFNFLSEKVIPYQSKDDIFEILNKNHGSIKLSMALRGDLLQIIRNKRYRNLDELIRVKAWDQSFKTWLSTALIPDSIQLKRITFDTSSGNILESVAKGEAVHSVRSLSELKRRLGYGRRCYGFFHNSLPVEPLVFIHIALTDNIAKSLRLDTVLLF